MGILVVVGHDMLIETLHGKRGALVDKHLKSQAALGGKLLPVRHVARRKLDLVETHPRPGLQIRTDDPSVERVVAKAQDDGLERGLELRYFVFDDDRSRPCRDPSPL